MINAQVIAAGSRTLLCVREHWEEKLQSQKHNTPRILSY